MSHRRSHNRILAGAIGCLALAWQAAVLGETQARNPNDVTWSSVGPAPPAIEAAVVADALTHTIYVGSLGGGVFKSTDAGVNFIAVNNGLDLGVSTLAMAPNDPNVVYAGTYKTTDGGVTWNPTGEENFPLAMVIDPFNPNILYAGYYGGLEKSVDGGATWQESSAGMEGGVVFSMVIDPNDPNTLYAGTTGLGAFKSTDGAVTWSPLALGTTVWSLLVDPGNSNVVYAGTDGNGVYRSTDAGASFTRVGSPRVGVVLSLVKSGNRLYASTATEGVSVSEDAGATWKNTNVTDSSGLILSTDAAGGVYVGTNFDGAFQLPAGTNPRGPWLRMAPRELKNCHCQFGHAIAVDPAKGERVFFTADDAGILKTEDGGQHWSDAGRNGFTQRTARGIAFDPQQPRRIYVGSFIGGGLFKSEDHGQHWKRIQFGPSTIYVSGIAVDPVDHSVYVATVKAHDGIWKSVDFGETFTRIDRAPGAPPDEYLGLGGRGITVDQRHHRTVYFAGSGTWRSNDAGASWRLVDERSSFSVTVDPGDSHNVYIGTASSGVLKSTDGGNSFVVKSQGLPQDDPSDPDSFVGTSRTGSIRINPNHRNVVYVGTQGAGVFRSTNGGESWRSISTGLDDLDIWGLAMDPSDADILYASTSASSVYKTRNAGP